ncbi:MAG: hypothetical protein NC177_03480 [Ruminococcus flavefaciens]|nr:hypothetical protein [Ruminococcus flavefaciens]
MKKFLKKFGLFLVLFLVIMYFIGSCTEHPDYQPKEEKGYTPEYTELTPDEYQKQMDELVKQPPVTQTAFKSPVMTAYADFSSLYYTLYDTLKEYYDKTTYFFRDNWLIGAKDIYNYFFDDNESYPSAEDDVSVEPKEEVTIPFQYDFYGKNRVVYDNGTYEIITCRIITTSAKSSGKTGHIRYTRENQYHQFTQFGFDIRVSNLSRKFDNNEAFTVVYYGLKSGMSGLTSSFVDSELASSHKAVFLGNSKNSLKQFNAHFVNAVEISDICDIYNSSSSPNYFTISSTTTNDYEFSQSVNNYYFNYKYWRLPNVYYNNNAGDIITKNNINNYNEYGYTYNTVTNSIEFDPNLYADFFDLNIKPQLELEFDRIFSKFPDIDATYSDDDTTINYIDLVTIMKEIQATSTTTTAVTGTYPLMTGDINVNVDVTMTFPPEFYKTYPALTTEPAFVAENPDVDFALDEPLPVHALEVSGGLLTLASSFFDDVGLMPIILMSVALGFVVMFFL